jgi:hypothetical protein
MVCGVLLGVPMNRLVCALLLCLSAPGATLERLSLDEMAARSTAVVRARALSSSASLIGSTIYTRTTFQVLETWKGPAAGEVQVVEPGGTVGGITQSYSGVPRFGPGQEMVLFLWTGPSGRTQVIGLTQGAFQVTQNALTGEPEAVREPSGELMLAPGTGQPVREERLVMPLRSLAARVRATPGARSSR